MKIRVLLCNCDFDSSHMKICENLKKNSFKVYLTDTNKIEFIRNHEFKSNGWEVHVYKLSVIYTGTVEIKNTKRGLLAIIHIKNKVGFLFRTCLLLMVSIFIVFFRLDCSLVFCFLFFFFCTIIMYSIYVLKSMLFARVLFPKNKISLIYFK